MIIIKNKKLLLSLGLFFVAFLFTGCAFLNKAPIIESTPITTAKEGALYTYEVEATDPDGDELEFTLLIIHPTGMIINSSTGVINWTPTKEQIGENEVGIEVSDQYRSTSQSFTITVSETILTSIVVLPTTMTIKKGGSQTITSVTAYYDNGTSANVLSSCTYASNVANVTVTNIGKISVSAQCAATAATITVSYTEDNITKTDTVNVTITGG
ncbi:MAG: putative Ig domain-containing protein [Candidatus Atribacteria bacterium]|nr:putative Ig domain-containing protein [Candidatus Atribacteria bacterium]